MKDLSKKTESKPKLDVISALYVDKTPEEMEADDKQVEFFHRLLETDAIYELLQGEVALG